MTKLAGFISSPFRLTSIRDLPRDANEDTIGIKDILGDPLIKEAWIWNFCFDVDWVMSQFDPDVRDLVSVKLIHGSWRREDGNKIHIDEASSRYANVEAIQAYLPDPFGTHHTKMIIVLRHDERAQVIVHTANMIAGDWSNMTEAVWLSPMLPYCKGLMKEEIGSFGSGSRFKFDLLNYCHAYGRKLEALTRQLQCYDFTAIRAAFVASVPSKQWSKSTKDKTLWGHPSIRQVLTDCLQPTATGASGGAEGDEVICQVSSIATLKKTWLTDTLFRALAPVDKPRFSIVFPTSEEVRRSRTGYAGGGSIHLKAQSAAHQKQIEVLRPYLRHWAAAPGKDMAKRGLAAPHIKTYVRITRDALPNSRTRIQWALLTSANLSVQAWGTEWKEASKKDKEEGNAGLCVHIQSYEAGVLIWPELFEDEQRSVMMPVYGTDMPTGQSAFGRTVVGLRMPYSLPLEPYQKHDTPWSPNLAYTQPDSRGNVWP